MADETGKPRTREALIRAGDADRPLIYDVIAREAGVPVHVVQSAVTRHVSPETAGKLCVVLGELAGLSASERREVFAEMIHPPGAKRTKDSLVGKVSSEDPNFFLWEAAGSQDVGHYSFDGHKARGFRPPKERESNAAEDRQDPARDAEGSEREEG